MATLTDFITRVRIQIRDNGTVQAFPDLTDAQGKTIPGSSPELQQFSQDAVMEFSRYRPRKRPFTLNLVPGQTSYLLPTDWITVDNGSFEKAIMPEPLPDPTVYALPFVYVNHPLGTQLNTMRFNWYDDDQTLTLDSAPFQAYSLTFDYYAYHMLDAKETTIPVQMQQYAILPACERALRAIATDYAVKLQKYKVGGRYGIEVDDSKISANLEAQADKYNEEFRKKVILRPYGTSGGGD